MECEPESGATGALGVAVGFLPLLGTSLNLPVLESMSVVAVLALASTLTQPWMGRLGTQVAFPPGWAWPSAWQ